MDRNQPVFSESSHALLFALIARQVITRYGEAKGLPALRKAIRRYGEQRGRRMALRARANGDELTMTNYLVYGEWRYVTDGGQSERVEEQADIRMLVTALPLGGSLERGGFAAIRALLLPGNRRRPAARLQSRPADRGQPDLIQRWPCRASLSTARRCWNPAKRSPYIRDKAALLESQRLMPWEYHCGHLYQACSLVMGEEFGPPGRLTVQNALAEFALRYGGAAAGTVAGYLKMNFDRLPDLSSPV